ncbi:small multi-drug export protein [Methanoregula sp.]|uniref:small multi-drug export protein n=1 Tax=Methanoregula sp. TaxID=2052170 RepID=UPI00237060E7|nr:small multi-drug export protein [Methanoregula sp.]MDD1686923.1 small multi-drug export protein [Methanoregula sp.]
MTDAVSSPVLPRITRAVAICLLFVVVLPVGAALLFTLPLTSVFALIGSALLIEYGAAPVGIALGLSPVYVFLALTSIALGVILALFELFDTAGEQSARVHAFLEQSRKRAGESRILSDYGIFGLVIAVLVLGIYLCPPIAWVCGWDRKRSIALILAGFCSASVALICTTTEIMAVIFPAGGS